jgi:hypothetical protein
MQEQFLKDNRTSSDKDSSCFLAIPNSLGCSLQEINERTEMSEYRVCALDQIVQVLEKADAQQKRDSILYSEFTSLRDVRRIDSGGANESILAKILRERFAQKEESIYIRSGVLSDTRALDTTTQAPEISEAYLGRRIEFMVGTMKEGSK